MTDCSHAKIPFEGATHLRMCDLHQWLTCPEAVWRKNDATCPYKKELKE